MDNSEDKSKEMAAPSKDSGQLKERCNTNTAVMLSNDELAWLLSHLPVTAKQAQRFVSALADGEKSTSFCNNTALAVNLSDLRQKYCRYLTRAGYELRCRHPAQPINNRLGEPSGQVYWGLYLLPKQGVAA